MKQSKYMKWERKFMRSDAHYDPDYPPLPAAAWNAALRRAISIVNKYPNYQTIRDQMVDELKSLMYK